MSHTVRNQGGRAVPLLLACVIAALSGCGGSAPAAPDPHGIGTVCDADIDCSTGLFCNTDPVIAAPHGQCTDACGDSAASCVQQAGPFTVCTAGVCVLTCRVDADCPAQTGCSAEGQCDRSVTRAATGAHCVGTPDGCQAAYEAGSDCDDTVGCTSVEHCAGTATLCDVQDPKLCGYSGCYLDPRTGICGGTPRSCESAAGESSCFDRAGCQYRTLCVGTAEPCERLRPSQCIQERGCRLE